MSSILSYAPGSPDREPFSQVPFGSPRQKAKSPLRTAREHQDIENMHRKRSLVVDIVARKKIATDPQAAAAAAPKPRRIGIHNLPKLPKVQTTWTLDGEIHYAITLKDRTYQLRQMPQAALKPTTHQIWLADNTHVLKLYRQVLDLTLARIINADTWGARMLQAIVDAAQCRSVRLARLDSNPIQDGYLLQEYVQGDKFWTQWSGRNTPISELDSKSIEILTIARDFLKLLWDQQKNVVENDVVIDISPENCQFHEGKLVIFDWVIASHDDLILELERCYHDWAQNNPAVEAFLYAAVPDFFEASEAVRVEKQASRSQKIIPSVIPIGVEGTHNASNSSI